MERRDFEQHPEDLEQVADWLRAQRPEVTPLELDRIKQAARAQAMRGERRGAGVARGRRPLATALTALVLTASFGGAFAIAGKLPPSSSTSVTTSAAKKQYQPGKGCGSPSKHGQPPPPQPNPCP